MENVRNLPLPLDLGLDSSLECAGVDGVVWGVLLHRSSYSVMHEFLRSNKMRIDLEYDVSLLK